MTQIELSPARTAAITIRLYALTAAKADARAAYEIADAAGDTKAAGELFDVWAEANEAREAYLSSLDTRGVVVTWLPSGGFRLGQRYATTAAY
jgi:hypothetical protein